jgi:hypothetical protein
VTKIEKNIMLRWFGHVERIDAKKLKTRMKKEINAFWARGNVTWSMDYVIDKAGARLWVWMMNMMRVEKAKYA